MAERNKMCICGNCGSGKKFLLIGSMTGGTDRDFGEADRRSEKAPRCVSCAHSAEVATDGGWNLEGLVKYHVLSKESERTLAEKHIVVCPFCEVGHPIPKDFDAIHRCICGACYKVCANDLLDAGVSDIADELWTDGELDFIRSVPIDFCNVIVEKDFDRLLDLKQNLDPLGIERFCKYDLGVHLSLVWVKRLF